MLFHVFSQFFFVCYHFSKMAFTFESNCAESLFFSNTDLQRPTFQLDDGSKENHNFQPYMVNICFAFSWRFIRPEKRTWQWENPPFLLGKNTSSNGYVVFVHCHVTFWVMKIYKKSWKQTTRWFPAVTEIDPSVGTSPTFGFGSRFHSLTFVPQEGHVF